MFLKDPWESKIRWPIMKRKECCCCYLIHQFYRTIFKRKRPKMCRGTWSMEWLFFCSKTTTICTPKLYIPSTYSKHWPSTVAHTIESVYSILQWKKNGRIQKIFDIENWLWKPEFWDLHGQIHNRALICQRPCKVQLTQGLMRKLLKKS